MLIRSALDARMTTAGAVFSVMALAVNATMTYTGADSMARVVDAPRGHSGSQSIALVTDALMTHARADSMASVVDVPIKCWH